MWKKKHSLILTMSVVIIAALDLVYVMITGPSIIGRLTFNSAYLRSELQGKLLITLYVGGTAALVLAAMLVLLLRNIYKNIVFDPRNIALLRYISWCCALGAVIAFVSATYYIAWSFVGIAAAFMCLLVRVIKNILAQAYEIKLEQDYTI